MLHWCPYSYLPVYLLRVRQLDKDSNAHLTIHVIAPDQSCHYVAVGITTSTATEMTEHALQMVLDHAEHVTMFYGMQGWGV